MNSAFRLLRRPLAAVASILCRLAGNRDGNVALLFGLAAIPVVVGAGIAMDTARAYTVKTRLGSALDAAALAVGSQISQNTATLTTDLKNYFYNNYCKAVPSGTTVTACTSTGNVAGESTITVTATSDITAATVTYVATATVPTTFMRLVGVNNLTVSVTTQTTKFPGMEIALVLDNTGSMLCGDSESNCVNGVVTNDTNCTNTNNSSRICTLRNAANSFVQTIQQAITGPQSIYISVVPYVTNVNVGPSFCTNSTTCSHIATDSASGDFTDLRGYIMPVVPISGTVSSSSSTISSVAMLSPTGGASTSGTAAIQPGMYIYGPGIPANATVSTVSSSSITISANATADYTGAGLAVGPNRNITNATQVSATPDTSNPLSGFIIGTQVNGTYSTSNLNVTGTTTTGLATGMYVNTSGTIDSSNASSKSDDLLQTGSTAANTISSISNGTTMVLLGNKPTASTTSSLDISNVKGTLANNSATISNVTFRSGSGLTISSIVPGMIINANGIGTSSTISSVLVKAVSGSSITMSANATRSGQTALLFRSSGGTATSGSSTLTNVYWTGTAPAVGNVITGTGIPANTTIATAPSTTAQYAAGTGTLTISKNATSTFNAELNSFKPLTYDSTYNSTTPAGASTTAGWGGCVIEPTSSGENSSGTGALPVAGNPDTSEPVSSTSWYPMYWTHDSTNSWTTTGAAQDAAHETQGGELTEWQAQPGANQGCPVPILPLTDLTTTAGQNSITNRINDMWSRDSGGTQVHVGMIWGWRVLSSNGPFTANGGHPLDYASAQSQGWKKIVVLMTDGQEEWPAAANLTGLGQVADGKAGSTSTTTAASNLDTRLSTLCTAMLNSATNGQKNFIVYTVGLGSGNSNTTFTNCAGNGGSNYTANTGNLTQKFQDIANSISHLRLVK